MSPATETSTGDVVSPSAAPTPWVATATAQIITTVVATTTDRTANRTGTMLLDADERYGVQAHPQDLPKA